MKKINWKKVWKNFNKFSDQLEAHAIIYDAWNDWSNQFIILQTCLMLEGFTLSKKEWTELDHRFNRWFKLKRRNPDWETPTVSFPVTQKMWIEKELNNKIQKHNE